jgi:hypothetical protein
MSWADAENHEQHRGTRVRPREHEPAPRDAPVGGGVTAGFS